MSSQKKITQLEREYFIKKNGAINTAEKTTSIKRKYFISLVGAISNSQSVDSLEKLWLKKIASDAGYTPSDDLSGLWLQAVLSISQQPSKRIEENKRIFFVNAP